MAVALHEIAHQLSLQLVDDIIGDLSAVIVALIYDRAIFVLLGVVVASEVRITGAGCVGKPNVSQAAARKLIH